MRASGSRSPIRAFFGRYFINHRNRRRIHYAKSARLIFILQFRKARHHGDRFIVQNVCVTSSRIIIKNIKISKFVLLLCLNVCVKFKHNFLIGLKVIWLFSLHLFVNSRFVYLFESTLQIWWESSITNRIKSNFLRILIKF